MYHYKKGNMIVKQVGNIINNEVSTYLKFLLRSSTSKKQFITSNHLRRVKVCMVMMHKFHNAIRVAHVLDHCALAQTGIPTLSILLSKFIFSVSLG